MKLVMEIEVSVYTDTMARARLHSQRCRHTETKDLSFNLRLGFLADRAFSLCYRPLMNVWLRAAQTALQRSSGFRSHSSVATAQSAGRKISLIKVLISHICVTHISRAGMW